MKTLELIVSGNVETAAKLLTELSGVLAVDQRGNSLTVHCGDRLDVPQVLQARGIASSIVSQHKEYKG